MRNHSSNVLKLLALASTKDDTATIMNDDKLEMKMNGLCEGMKLKTVPYMIREKKENSETWKMKQVKVERKKYFVRYHNVT